MVHSDVTAEAWPAADWDVWPDTRATALLFDLFVLICLAVPFVLTRSRGSALFATRDVRWGFLVNGWTTLHHDAAAGELVHTRLAPPACCCCVPLGWWTRATVTRVRVADVARVSLAPPRAASDRETPCMTPAIIAGGCILGLWLHFVPCIWWTCDWGPHDGEGVRGGIWFLGWPFLSLALWRHDAAAREGRPRGAITVTGRDGSVLAEVPVPGSAASQAAAKDAVARLEAALVDTAEGGGAAAGVVASS